MSAKVIIFAKKSTNIHHNLMKIEAIIFSAPSGSGKSTIVHHLIERFDRLEFSISAASRAPRGDEKDGVDYHFLSVEKFRELIGQGEFLEYEEVYPGSFYGTLKSEVERINAKGHVAIFDIDVKGGVNLKKIFGDKALALFIKAPSVAELKKRLEGRGTDSPESIAKRIAKAEEELTYEPHFDRTIVNDDLEKAFTEADRIIEAALKD